MYRHRLIVLRLLVVAGLIVSACSTGEGSSSRGPDDDTAPSEATTYSISAYDTDDVVSLDGEPLDPLPFAEPATTAP